MSKTKSIVHAITILITLTLASGVGPGAPTDNKKGHFMAKFNKQDFINITAGEEVTFTVTAIVEHRGHQIAFEGNDTVRVR